MSSIEQLIAERIVTSIDLSHRSRTQLDAKWSRVVYTVGDNEVFTALQSAGDEVLRRIIEIGEHLHMSSPILVGGMPDIGCDTPGIGLVYGRVREQAEQQISDLIGTHALTLSASDVTAFAERMGEYTTSYELAVREALSRRGY